jgi:uncharacterized protein YbjT (DUF2867 family)
VKIGRITLLGGTGFVGRHVVHELAKGEREVRVLTRQRVRARELFVLPNVEILECDVHDPRQLGPALAGCDAVISLVGVLNDSRAAGFAKVHVDLARHLVDACRQAGIKRLLQMSSLHAGAQAPSEYLRSKGEAERIVLDYHGKEGAAVTVFRPSVIFGPGDNFVHLFAKLIRVLPVILLACPSARFQPIYVEDVAKAMVHSLEDPMTFGERYDLCGPKAYAFKELVEFIAVLLGKRRLIIGLGKRLSYLMAWAMEWSPFKLMTRDNYRSMQIDSVCSCEFPAVFGIKPATLESIIVDEFGGGAARGRYRLFRHWARRRPHLY